MDLTRCKAIILFGGSFDPPHIAHVRLPELVRARLGADCVAYVPAAESPHKRGLTRTPAVHRLAMLRAAVEGLPRAVVLTDELDRAKPGEPSYTVDTLESLRRRLGVGPVFRLLIGADQLRVFHKWHQSKRIVELAEPVVMVRPPDTALSLLAALPPGEDAAAWRGRLVDLPPIDVSSTDLRRRAAAGESLAGLTPPAVEAYIRQHRLYQA